MNFAQQRIFAYDAARFGGLTLQSILRAAHDDARQKFTIAGVEDVLEVLLITDEWYTAMTPVLPIKELERGQEIVDSLWNEPISGRMTFSRVLNAHARTTLTDPQVDLKKSGLTYTQSATVHFGLLGLYQLDYWPYVGDRFIWMGREYQFSKVLILPKSYMAYTGIPLHVTCEADLVRQGDEATPDSLLDQGIGDNTTAPTWLH